MIAARALGRRAGSAIQKGSTSSQTILSKPSSVRHISHQAAQNVTSEPMSGSPSSVKTYAAGAAAAGGALYAVHSSISNAASRSIEKCYAADQAIIEATTDQGS